MTDYKDLWRKVLQRLEPAIQRNMFITWFQNTGPVNCDAGVLVLGFPHAFAKEWIEKRYVAEINQYVKELDPAIQRVVFQVESGFYNGSDPRTVPLDSVIATISKTVRKMPRVQEVKIDGGLRSKMLNVKYRLDTFIAGRNNRLPHAACMAVGNQPGGIYNPLFLYGGVGLGKTHLLQATANEILKNYPQKLVVYVTSEHFVNEVVHAIKMRGMNALKERYRKIDCLIVDDVQFFGEKTSSQEEFFHTFNDLYDSNKQILLSSDRPPKDLEFLDDRLRSRFGMGMVTEVLAPEYETRLAILQTKCQELGVIFDHEVLACIAYHTERSVRDLLGVLKSLIASMQLQGVVPSVNDALNVINQFQGMQNPTARTSGSVPSYPSPVSSGRFVRDAEEIISVVAKYFRVSKQELVGEDRRKEILVPRQICMYLIRQELNEAYEKIGADFGGKNHTTVLHAVNKIQEMLKGDHRVVRDVHAIRKELGL